MNANERTPAIASAAAEAPTSVKSKKARKTDKAPDARDALHAGQRDQRTEERLQLMRRAYRRETKGDEPAALFDSIDLTAVALLGRAMSNLLRGKKLGKRMRKACCALERLVAPLPALPEGRPHSNALPPRAAVEGFVASAAAGDIGKVRRYLAAYDPRALCSELADLGVWLHDGADNDWRSNMMPPRTALFAAIRARHIEMVKLLLPFSDPFQAIPDEPLYKSAKKIPPPPRQIEYERTPSLLNGSSGPTSAFEEAIRLVDDESLPPLAMGDHGGLVAERRRQSSDIHDEVLRHASSLPKTATASDCWTLALFASAAEDNVPLANLAIAHADRSRTRCDRRSRNRMNALEFAARHDASSVVRVLCAAPAYARRSRALRTALRLGSWRVVEALVEQARSDLGGEPARGAIQRAGLYVRLMRAEATDTKTYDKVARHRISEFAEPLIAKVERVEMLSGLATDESRAPMRKRALRAPRRC
ncbi:hypothetical protein LA345_13180 [Burkholderia vietnamiensis]|uniref:Ankyrin n=1 Tax=Burkholderia vietnamiensis (strain G4 / LMG 22486) TaxID=269482 RepID=A4JFQ3_BURVG|nr:hypothetical protein Bcep1808_2104 [Burkholderia vietnamiensis G4]MCB4344866.1 hypothetical protein [Burkholderia vietnamiensis]